MASPQLFDEYDIIIAGGGATAGVIFGRLATADPSLRILMLEKGPTTRDDLAHTQPARNLQHLTPGSTTTKPVVGKPSDYLNGRELTIHCGQCVGGGSSVSFMGYMQPAPSDYDDWSRVHNNPGWSSKDLLPLIKKAETYQAAPAELSDGSHGPLKVSYGGMITNIGEEYIAAISQYDKPRAIVKDVGNTPLLNHVHYWAKWIDRDTGRRSDVAHSYVYPVLDRSQNAHLLPNCAVRKVIIKDGKAIGVEYVQMLPVADSASRTARAAKLIVLSAGTFGSPAILERSGIGSKDILDRNGVEQVVDLPGVGENFTDHPSLFVPFYAKEDADNLGGIIIGGDSSEHENGSAKWHKDEKGLIGSNGVDGVMRYRPSQQELQRIGHEFAERWASFYTGAPDKPVIVMGLLSAYLGPSPPPENQKMYSTCAYVTHPVSKGSVHITSANDVDAPVNFDAGLFRRKEDLVALRYAWKVCREHGRRMSSFRGEYAPGHPKYPAGSVAAVSLDRTTPVPVDAPDIVYTEEDNDAIDDLLKSNAITAWDSLGTCAMKLLDEGGVVDSHLNVYGIQNLKIADLSICPSVVGSNACSVAVLVGEKAAVLIAEELGIANV